MSEESEIDKIKKLNIQQRIHGIMSEVGNLPKTKEIKNKNGVVMYKVVESEKLDAALKPLLLKYRIIIVPSVISAKNERITETTKYGDKTENHTMIVVQVMWQNIDDPSQIISGEWPSLGIDGGDKGIGKAITYAMRIARTKTLNISTGEPEPEETPPDQPKEQKPSTKKKSTVNKLVSKKERDDFIQHVIDADVPSATVKELMKTYGIADSSSIPEDKLEELTMLVTKIGEQIKEETINA